MATVARYISRGVRMSNPLATQLRLAAPPDAESTRRWAEEAEARRQITRENRAAAHSPELQAHDPRWVLAARASQLIEGDAIPLEARGRLHRTAGALGVRPFEASLVLAIVQEQARRGEPLANAASLLEMVPAPRRVQSPDWVRWTAAITGAALLALLLIRWIAAG